MFDAINIAVLIGAGLVAVSGITSLVSQRLGAPLLLVFLGIGLLAGEDGLLGIRFDGAGAAYFIGSVALAIILFDSGFATPIRSYRVAAPAALTLATLGVILTAAFMGAGAHYLLGLPWIESMMLGAIVASTDAAAVFFLMRVGGITIRERVKSTLEIESGANDPMAIFLTATLVEFAAASGESGAEMGVQLLVDFVLQIGLGIVLGIVGGFLITRLMNRLEDVDPALYPITALAAGLVVFAAAGLLGGSGFLAAYVAGLVAGNSRIRFAHRIRRFQIGMSWLAQIGMFLTLGLLATPSTFEGLTLPALALAAGLIFIARPLAVWICLLPFGFTSREVAFVGWVGLRGAVSILLSILPTLGGVPGGGLYFNIVFMMVLSSLLIQGWTISFAARALRLLVPPEPGRVDRVELDLPGKTELELVGYRIHPESSIAAGERVPRWARPLLIIRSGRALSIHNAGPLEAGDRVYLFGTPDQLPLLDRVYTRPGGADDPDVIGHFPLNPDTTVGQLSDEYALNASGERDRTLGDLLQKAFHDQPVVGDRLTLGPIALVVRAVDEGRHVTEVGMILQPGRNSIGRPPGFKERLRNWFER